MKWELEQRQRQEIRDEFLNLIRASRASLQLPQACECQRRQSDLREVCHISDSVIGITYRKISATLVIPLEV